jgi:hypothetical protein
MIGATPEGRKELVCAFRKNGTAVSPVKGQQFR